MAGQLVLQLLQQAALADAGFGQHGQGMGRLLLAHGLERLQQLRQFFVAADQRCFLPLDTPCRQPELARLQTFDEPAAHRRFHTLDADRLLRLRVEQTPHEAPGVMADPQATRRRTLFHPGGDMHRLAAQRVVTVHAATAQDRAGVDAYAHPKTGVTLLEADLFTQARALGEQGQAAAHRAFGVILARAGGTEGGHQVVVRVLQHFTAVLAHHGTQPLQRPVEHTVNGLRVQLAGQQRGTHHVQEQDADLAQLLLGRTQRGLGGQASTQRRERHIDHGVAQYRTLGLQGIDGRLQRGDRIFGHA
jgi:hypothetical protein